MYQTQTLELFAEIYPINRTNLSQLHSWQIHSSLNDQTALGRKIAYRLAKLVGGHWIWVEDVLVTDGVFDESTLAEALSKLWADPAANFGAVRDITPILNWNPSVESQATFVAFGLCFDFDQELKNQLGKQRRSLNNAYVERTYDLRGWNVLGEPALSISASSEIISTVPLGKLIQGKPHETLLGLMVRDKTSSTKGEIAAIIGNLGQHRERLLKLTKRDQMKSVLQNAKDEEPVVHIESGFNNGYDYPISALNIIVRTMDYERLGIDGQNALSALQIRPADRAKLVQELAQIISQHGLINPEPFKSSSANELFLFPEQIKFTPSGIMGDKFVTPCDSRTILKALKTHPPYRLSKKMTNKEPIRLGVLNLIGGNDTIQRYLADIRSQLREIKFDVTFTGAERISVSSQINLKSAVERLGANNPHLLIALLPGMPSEDSDIENNLYNRVKATSLAQDIQTQVIYEKTVGNEYALANIILGILAKVGIIPYVLSEPLPYADAVAGIDIARERTKRRSGSINLAAVTRIYLANGDFVRYFMQDAPLEGETLALSVLRRLFPVDYFGNKRVVIHRDGLFRGDEEQHLHNIAEEMGSQFHLVEVIKSGAPRLYLRNSIIDRPSKGSICRLNEREALVISSLPIHKNSTPRPLLVRTKSGLSIEDAVHSILSLTMLHYGSVLPPRLPVTTHYSDRMGYLALHGIKPNQLEGDEPFWM